jgi:IS1 family transposase
MNCLTKEQQRQVLMLMCRHNGINDIVEITGHSANTVRGHLARFGEALAASHDRLVRGISPRRIEVDELWSYVYAKREKNITREPGKRPPPADRGAFFTWAAMDPDTKVFITWQVGDRSENTGRRFLADLYVRVLGRTLITSDGYGVYPDAIKAIFGPDADHVSIQKEIKGWRNPETGERGTHVISMEKVLETGKLEDLSLASTSLVERLNASIRNFVSRFTRQTYRFSKKLENHVHAHSIFVMYYNFVKPHRGFKGAERHFTPAMKAGLTDRLWSVDDLIDEVDRYWQHKAMQPMLRVVPPPKYVPLQPGHSSSLPFFVMYAPKKREARVHNGECRNCRHGIGRKDGGAGSNRWYAFETERAARRCAESLAPLNYSVCSMCVTGQYVRHRVRSRR